MEKRVKLKYKDLPSELNTIIYITYGNITKSQNPTVNHILKVLKRRKNEYDSEGFYKSVEEFQEAILMIEDTIKELHA